MKKALKLKGIFLITVLLGFFCLAGIGTADIATESNIGTQVLPSQGDSDGDVEIFPLPYYPDGDVEGVPPPYSPDGDVEGVPPLYYPDEGRNNFEILPEILPETFPERLLKQKKIGPDQTEYRAYAKLGKTTPWYKRFLLWVGILKIKENSPGPYCAEYADISAEVLHLFAQSDDSEVRKVAAAHKNTAAADLTHLSKDEDVEIRKLVAGNARTTVATLRELGTDAEADVREIVARNERTPEDTLIALSNDEEESVRLAVLDNANAPAEATATVFWKLAEESRKTEHLTIIATSQRIDPEILRELAKNDIAEVRLQVARNNRTPKDTLTVLAVKDTSSAVRRAAVQTLENITGTNWTPVILLCAFFAVLAVVGYVVNRRKEGPSS